MILGGFIDVLRFVLVFWLRSLGTLRFPPAGKLVSQTSRLGIRPVLPTVEAQGAYPQRSRQATPLHSISNAESAPERQLLRVLLVRPFAALVWLGSSLSWFDHTQPSPLFPIASTGHPSIASRQRASSSGVVGCLKT